jgi:hypothetical protein
MRIFSAFVVVVLAVAGLSARQDSATLRPELAKTAISMQFDGVALSDGVMTLGKLAGVAVQIAPEVKDLLQKTKFVTEKFLYTTFEAMLAKMVVYVGLTYKVIDDHTVLIMSLEK